MAKARLKTHKPRTSVILKLSIKEAQVLRTLLLDGVVHLGNTWGEQVSDIFTALRDAGVKPCDLPWLADEHSSYPITPTGPCKPRE